MAAKKKSAKKKSVRVIKGMHFARVTPNTYLGVIRTRKVAR